MKKTLYQILDVDPKASAEDIEAAYRRLTAMRDTQWPDANMPGLVRQAHEILSDPKRRGAYDRDIAVNRITIGKSSAWIGGPRPGTLTRVYLATR